jgi:DNA-binding transcriptional MerR regulator
MTLSHSPLWTLEQLNEQVLAALSVDYPGQANGRVREMPDVRTIRYYVTRGLLDRPAQMRGRTALYGERHLLQLVAIKRLQARGLSLTEIQPRVVGQTNSVLRRLAQLPARRPPTEPTKHSQAEQASADQRCSAFWGAAPAAVPERETITEEQKSGEGSVLPLVGVTLDEDVTLLLKPKRLFDEQDVEALRSAAAPLLKILKTLQARSASDG